MNTSIFISEESARCMLCQNAPCTKACASGQPDRFIRSLRFDNISQSMKWIEECSSDDLAAAESACIHYDSPIRISALAEAVRNSRSASHQEHLPSLEIKFCGLTCENPFFLASSAVCTNYEMVAKAFDAGWAGVFYKTICFQEINEVSPRFDAVHSSKRGDFYGFRNMEQLSENPVEMDFDILSRLKKNYPSKIVVASIMGQTEEEWIELAKMAEKAGVDAIELNFSCPQMRLAGMGSDVGQNSELVTFYTAYVKRNVSIPVIPKMTPNITNMNVPATGAYFAGADALRSFTDADIAMVNGGGIRTNIKRGEILFNDLYNVMPFGDMIATSTFYGEQLLDVLEFAVSALPAEAGTFMQVSGLRFTVDPDIPSPVMKDTETGMFSHVGEGERRVSHVEILDKQSGEYKAVELSRQYTIATLDYLILEQGGSGILSYVKPDSIYWGADIEVLRHYLESVLGGNIGSEYTQPQGRIIYKYFN